MNLEAFDIVIFILGVAAGFGVSIYFKKAPQQQSISTIEGISATSLQQDMDKKQLAIDEFFEEANDTLVKTEGLLSELRSQLANGASALSSTEIPKLVASPEKLETGSEQDDVIEPPLDYAPKEHVDSPGMLSEEFGLSQDKTKETEKEKEGQAS